MSRRIKSRRTAKTVEEKVEPKVIKEVTAKPVYKAGWLGWFTAKVCITFTRWLADKVFGKFADWVEGKLKKEVVK